MIYATEERALEVAKLLNKQRGYPPAYAVPTAAGWTVVRTYGNPTIWSTPLKGATN